MCRDGYLWNSGIFVWRVGDFISELQAHTPEIAPALEVHGDDVRAFFNAVKPIGVGDLKVVKQWLTAYRPGEISHIHNVMDGETRSRAHRRTGAAVKAREREQVVAHVQQQIRGLFLDDDADAPPDLERRFDRIVAEDFHAAAGRPRERGHDAQRCRLAGAVRAEQPEDRSGPHRKREVIDGTDRGAADVKGLDEIGDDNRRCGHEGALSSH